MGPKRLAACFRLFVYSLLAFLGLSRAHRTSLTEWDEILAKDRAKVDGLLGSEEGVRIQLVAGGGAMFRRQQPQPRWNCVFGCASRLDLPARCVGLLHRDLRLRMEM